MKVLPGKQAPQLSQDHDPATGPGSSAHLPASITSRLRMNSGRQIAVALALAVLALAIIGSFLTRGAMEYLPFLRANSANGGAGTQVVVDQSPWKTAETLAALAKSSEEHEFAREAQRLADHEVDQAFAQALRQANFETRALSGDALALQRHIKDLEATVQQDQAAVAALAPKAGTPAASADDPTLNDDLEVAKAQLGLDQDQVTAASQELARKSNDPRTKIQQELVAREAAMKSYDASANGDGATSAVVSSARYKTLSGQFSTWFEQRTRTRLLEEARQQAESDANTLSTQRASLIQQAATSAASSASAKAAGQTGSLRVKTLQRMAAQQSILSIVDDRIATHQQLAAVYGFWSAQVQIQHSIMVHLMMLSLILIASIFLGTLLAGWGLQAALRNLSRDPRQRQTLSTVLNLGTQLIGLLLILLVIFGAPKQTPTILGLATAGLTVVFQDFILAFCGWFILMGRNGVRVGDWVEIDGVGGEVVSISVFRTWLLETGNWTANGHPTGRRVSFLNGYAIKSKFFNFSTAGQWMWDEIKVSIPPSHDPYALIEKIRSATLKATENDARLAELEWKHVTHEQGMQQFSAAPSISLRPAGAGIDIIVRYVTRAGACLDTRNRLYRTIVELMLGPSPANLAVEPEVPEHSTRQLA
jgi:small-conductance mechanosensitive channel